MKPAILLDCDTGIDDALTVLYLAALVRAGEAELVAAGTVHGNVAADVGALNTLRVLERAGLPGVPVAVGAIAPMAQPARYAHEFHGTDGLGDSGLAEPAGRLAEVSAPEQIIRLARARPGERGLVADRAPRRPGPELAIGARHDDAEHPPPDPAPPRWCR